MTLAIAADDAALELKDALITHLAERDDVLVEDLGLEPDEDYPDVAERVAYAVRDHRADRGVLLCGTGIGVAIAANKVPGIRAACCHDPYSAERARKSNDAQVLTMGARDRTAARLSGPRHMAGRRLRRRRLDAQGPEAGRT